MELTGVDQISHFNKWLASPRKQFWLLLHDSEFSKSGCWGMYALRALNVVEHALHIVSVTSKCLETSPTQSQSSWKRNSFRECDFF